MPGLGTSSAKEQSGGDKGNKVTGDVPYSFVRWATALRCQEDGRGCGRESGRDNNVRGRGEVLAGQVLFLQTEGGWGRFWRDGDHWFGPHPVGRLCNL